ncbi:MAG: GxxExxY protein [Bacteroidales bacterium]|nr:GxxExxY protein [Bacteroidales bacterium]
MHENEIARIVVDICFQIHKKLGPGLLESVYEEILCYELRKRGLSYSRQKPIPVIWDEVKLEIGFRSDVIVENKVIVELKSVENITPVFPKIVLTYLRLTGLKLGLLVNFNVALIKDGIKRIVNGL